VLSLAKKRAHKKLHFSSEGWSELCNLHARVGANLQLALNVLVSGDIKDAQKLIKEKEEIRQLERDSHYQHLGRLRGKQIDSAETSNMHLEIVRAFKEINSLLVSASYPILTDGGLLLKSRLVNAPTQN
jgi:phosphate:Na+ symporter